MMMTTLCFNCMEVDTMYYQVKDFISKNSEQGITVTLRLKLNPNDPYSVFIKYLKVVSYYEI